VGDRSFFSYASEELTDRLTAKVNLGNGNLVMVGKDVSVAGIAGLDLSLTRYYNSALADTTGGGDPSKLGNGWSHNLGGSVRLEFPDGATEGASDKRRVFFHGPSGYRVRFEKSAAGAGVKYIRKTPGLDAELRFDETDNVFRLQWHDKQVYLFDDNGRLEVIRDKQGNELTMGYYAAGNLEGAPAGTLRQVTDTRGRTAHFSYDTNELLQSVEVRDPSGTPLVRYAYEYTGTPLRLATSRVDFVTGGLLHGGGDTQNLGAKTSYRYDQDGRLFEVENARDEGGRTGGLTIKLAYKSNGAVESLTRLTESNALPDSVTGFDYTLPAAPMPAACVDADNKTHGTHSTLVDGDRTDVADTTRYCIDEHDRVVRTVDAKGHVRKASYTDNSNVATANMSGVDAGGFFTTTYDANDNATQTQTPTGGTAGADYTDPSNLHFPTAMSDYSTGAARDGNGQLTSPTWSYDYDRSAT
jgi:hypothetical protein